jgi:serine/threonine protein phosphatase PrpC
MLSDSSFCIAVSALTHRGAVRPNNEDAIAIADRILVGDLDNPVVQELELGMKFAMVADGMGGHAQGALASRSALRSVIHSLNKGSDTTILARALCEANDALYDIMFERPEARGMGTTIVGVVFGENGVAYFNVGDSRAYRHRPGNLALLSHDDIPLGTRSSSLRRTSQTITQSIGGRLSRAQIAPHVGLAPSLKRDESILLCSDGLSDMVGDLELSRTLDEIPDQRERVMKLFELAMSRGGRDNISIVIAQPA